MFNYKSVKKLIIIDEKTKTIKQKRQLNPPTFNAMFRSAVRKLYPDYTLD